MAGTLTPSPVVEGEFPNGLSNNLYTLQAAFVDSNPASGVTNISLGTKLSGLLTDVRVLFGGTAPNTLTVAVKDAVGNTIVSGTVTASGSIALATPKLFVGGLTVSLSGNTTASATATLTFCFFV